MEAAHLVVNADDLGFSQDINDAIEAGHILGRITSATLMVDGAALQPALDMLRRNPSLGVGLHLDLCPVVGLYHLPYQEMRDNLRSAGMKAKVAAETERQITRFKALGLEFTHMDGHRHFHALPEIFTTVVEVAAAHGLKTIRLTRDWILPRTPSVYWSGEFHECALALLQRYGIRYPATFVYGWHGYSASSFTGGLNELMVHVGYNDPDYLREYNWLSSADIWGDIMKAGVHLVNYTDYAGR